MPDLDYIFPQPIPWNEIHQALVAFREKECPDASLPPVPLILGGWNYSSDANKAARWTDTIRWAETHGASRLIPELTDPDKYCLH